MKDRGKFPMNVIIMLVEDEGELIVTAVYDLVQVLHHASTSNIYWVLWQFSFLSLLTEEVQVHQVSLIQVIPS